MLAGLLSNQPYLPTQKKSWVNKTFSSCFNPIEKYWSEWESSPIFGVKMKNIWNHQPVVCQVLIFIHYHPMPYQGYVNSLEDTHAKKSLGEIKSSGCRGTSFQVFHSSSGTRGFNTTGLLHKVASWDFPEAWTRPSAALENYLEDHDHPS